MLAFNPNKQTSIILPIKVFLANKQNNSGLYLHLLDLSKNIIILVLIVAI